MGEGNSLNWHDLFKEHLPATEEEAIHLSDLIKEVNTNATQLKRAIRQERRQGTPILSSSKGYWLSSNPWEIEAYIKRSSKYGASLFETVRGLKNGDIEGQISLSDKGLRE